MSFSHTNMLRRRRIGFIPSAFSQLILVIFPFLLPSPIRGQYFDSEKPMFHIGFEGNTSVYRWANGYREQLVPTFNTTREARRSVVSGGLFSIVSFDNVPCNSDSSEVGTCYSNRECTNLEGTSSGICAGSYGTCCVLRQSCGSTIATNNTYFTNPDYPGTTDTTSGSKSCILTITPLDGATEIYLEFLDFNIRGPSSGACMNDTFTATNGDTAITLPIICGNNTGQHLYIPITGSGPITLSFNLAGTNAQFRADDGRSWKIRVVQFKPGDVCLAPKGCTQYFREPTGTFESFNFQSGMGELINNYCTTACFAITSPNCGVLLSEGTFMLPGTPPDCSEGDYFLIGGVKYCGDTLNNGMIMLNATSASATSGMPYAQVQVCSGQNNPDMDVGYSLNYSPYPCAMSG